MNLASFQEDILCPCITFPLHHFNVCLKHKAGAATFTAGLQRSNPPISPKRAQDSVGMQSRWKRQHRPLDPKS